MNTNSQIQVLQGEIDEMSAKRRMMKEKMKRNGYPSLKEIKHMEFDQFVIDKSLQTLEAFYGLR